MDAKVVMKETSIAAIVVRADGTREDLGVVSYWHRNPLRRSLFSLKKRINAWQR